jgi:hypothetical protein
MNMIALFYSGALISKFDEHKLLFAGLHIDAKFITSHNMHPKNKYEEEI